MRRAWLGVFLATTFMSATWMACVGDDPTTPSASDAGGPGSLDNACFGNGTCNSGLSCVSNVCVDLDGALGNDSSADASKQTDSGFVCDAGTIFTDSQHIPCPAPDVVCNANDGGIQCCAQSTGAMCETSGTSCSASSGAVIRCVLPSQCNSAKSVCCIAALNPATSFVDDTCPRTATIDQGSCEPSSVPCSTGERQACVIDADCPSGSKCHPYQTTYNDNTLEHPLVIGLCAPN